MLDLTPLGVFFLAYLHVSPPHFIARFVNSPKVEPLTKPILYQTEKAVVIWGPAIESVPWHPKYKTVFVIPKTVLFHRAAETKLSPTHLYGIMPFEIFTPTLFAIAPAAHIPMGEVLLQCVWDDPFSLVALRLGKNLDAVQPP